MAWNQAGLLRGRSRSQRPQNVQLIELLNMHNHEELLRHHQMQSWLHVGVTLTLRFIADLSFQVWDWDLHVWDVVQVGSTRDACAHTLTPIDFRSDGYVRQSTLLPSKYKAMLLTRVLAGNAQKLTQADPNLKGPPSGYDSVSLSVRGDILIPKLNTVPARSEAYLVGACLA